MVFVPGQLRNPLNGSWGSWHKHARTARAWRERTAMCVLKASREAGGRADHGVRPWTPKRITFTAHVWSLWDDDALPAALKPVRDAMVDVRIILDDGPQSGHVFVYAQAVNRQQRGVLITIEEP